MKKVWNHNKMSFGGDYNPEQWDEATWKEDMRLFKLAHVDTVTLNVFSWAALQPSEDVYDFSKLDKIMDMVKENGLKVVLATSTAAHPAWMAKRYPEILRTEFNGMRRKFGGRHNSCPNSGVYRKYSVRLAEKLAERYKDYDNVIAWHISNEYGGECYCDNCEKAFQVWLKDRYKTLDELNRAWNTSFWGHTFYDWDEIVVPNMLSEHFGYEHTMFQGISLDYKRFYSDSMLDCFRLEYDAVKKHTPDLPVTTNFMEFYKILDYQKWAKYLDFISWDSYPWIGASKGVMALNHELMRGLKQGSPFILMEQTPSVQNWQPYNELKRPGVMRLWSYQAVAHGADAVMFFQMRRSIGACEKYHGALIDHAGHENTRVFREMTELGADLEKIGERTLGSLEKADVAIVFDWDNWWAIEYSSGPSRLMKYRDEIQKYYNGFHDNNIAVDIVSVEDDLSKYKVVCAPMLYMVKPGMDEKLRNFVKNGGTLISSFFSGYVDENDLVTVGGYPGKLRDILGIWVEESDALKEGNKNSFTWNGEKHEATILCDLLHCEGAKSLTSYEEDFYAGMPVVTKNDFGSGKAYYVATRSDDGFYRNFLSEVCDEVNVKPVLQTPDGVEATARYTEDKKYLFLLNFADEVKEVKIDEDYYDVLDDTMIKAGSTITMEKVAVKVLESV